MGYSVTHGWWFHIFEGGLSIKATTVWDALNDIGFVRYIRDHRHAVLQLDNAPTHTITKAQIINRRLDWPPKSPDLNPVENIWAMMARYIKETLRPKNRTELREALRVTFEWVQREMGEVVKKMCSEYLKRMNKVLESGEWNIGY